MYVRGSKGERRKQGSEEIAWPECLQQFPLLVFPIAMENG